MKYFSNSWWDILVRVQVDPGIIIIILMTADKHIFRENMSYIIGANPPLTLYIYLFPPPYSPSSVFFTSLSYPLLSFLRILYISFLPSTLLPPYSLHLIPTPYSPSSVFFTSHSYPKHSFPRFLHFSLETRVFFGNPLMSSLSFLQHQKKRETWRGNNEDGKAKSKIKMSLRMKKCWRKHW